MNGKRPPRPRSKLYSRRMWKLTKHCWDQDPHLRPDISEVLRFLRSSLVTLFVHSDPLPWIHVAYALIPYEPPQLRPLSSLHSQIWDRLVSGQLTTRERTSLITTLFSDEDWYEIPRRFSVFDTGDMQLFIDAIDKVGLPALPV